MIKWLNAARHARIGNWLRQNPRLCRGPLAALGSDSAYDHEILHAYPLPGIIMRGCHALISADPVGDRVQSGLICAPCWMIAEGPDRRGSG